MNKEHDITDKDEAMPSEEDMHKAEKEEDEEVDQLGEDDAEKLKDM